MSMFSGGELDDYYGRIVVFLVLTSMLAGAGLFWLLSFLFRHVSIGVH